MTARASIIVPTRDRPGYLEVALASIAPQAAASGAELIVVDDGSHPATRAHAERFGARYVLNPRAAGLNAARNAGAEQAAGDLLIYVDDDVKARDEWLASFLRAASEHPDREVFAGRIMFRLEDHGLRACGREDPPITTLDLGERDRDARYAWGSNMAIRHRAIQRVGRFDPSIEGGGDEQEWQDRWRAETGGSVLYVAGAAVDHRRAGDDARLRSLARAAYRRGGAVRRFDSRQDRAPTIPTELRTFAGCIAHAVRYRCANGLVMTAHSAGRLRAAVERSTPPASRPGEDDFLSGVSGTVGGRRRVLRAMGDAALDARAVATGRRRRLARAAARHPARRVLVLAVERGDRAGLLDDAARELARSVHHVEVHRAPAGERGKFENLNELLAEHPASGHDWLLVIDDDVELPGGFLDSLVFLAERFGLALAQPAHRLASHAAWPVTRRRAASVVRETALVEIGPVTAFAAQTFDVLLPFPALRMGWGLDVHWAALARANGWRIGVVDAVAVRHGLQPAAGGYSRDEAVAEARDFLASRPYVPREQALQTLAEHRTWR
jgi:GT2 family glycosyltransferase